MRKDTIESIIIMVVAFALIGGGYLYIQTASDVDPTFTNVESWSMQHSDESQLGVIDTGDMVILKNKDSYSQLTTYVEGDTSGDSSFGEYGNVVVYERNPSSNLNPVIHRL
ncbi:MAG: S26 family signal peptidase, partial [Candidatus Methanomethylophilaceae archaeon]